MRTARTGRLVGVVAALAVLAAACVSDDPDPNVAIVDPGGEATVVMNEFTFLPSSLTVVAGSTVRVTLVNEGFVPHEFMVGRTVATGGGYDEDLLGILLVETTGEGFVGPPLDSDTGSHQEEAMGDQAMADMDGPPVEDDHDGDDGDDVPGDSDDHEGDLSHGGTHITVEPGGSVTMLLQTPEDMVGDWELGCFIEGHFEAGMSGGFTVAQGRV